MMHLLRPTLAVLALSSIALATAWADPTTLTVKMLAQNGSGETGTATLTQVTGGVQVVVNLTGAPSGAQPTHIHPGTCDKLDPAPKYPLSNTVNGTGTSTVKDVTLADLLKGTYAINVHKSTTDLATYVACGNIAQAK